MEIEVGFPGGRKVSARVGDHVVVTDQPERAGGEGSAPSPYELFLASVATCAGYFALAFCTERGLSMEGLKVNALYEKNPETKVLSSIRLSLTLPADFPEKYEKPIQRAIEQCSVRRAIAAQPAFEVVIDKG